MFDSKIWLYKILSYLFISYFHTLKYNNLKKWNVKWRDGCQKSAKKVSQIKYLNGPLLGEKKYFTELLFILPEK
jgi:hypothetical protein